MSGRVTAAKERPILMNAEMVRAVLDGRKTQTRLIVKPQPPGDAPKRIACEWYEPIVVRNHEQVPGDPVFGFSSEDDGWKCPFGGPGSRLWVRESFDIESFGAGVAQIRYKADGKRGPNQGISDQKLPNRCGGVPSIHMPRHASRITLEITSVRVERLQEISEKDAKAEGVSEEFETTVADFIAGKPVHPTFKIGFKHLWKSINGPGSWDANPFVWVIEWK